MTTEEIIKKCFKKAGMEFVKDERAKYLFRSLNDELQKSLWDFAKKVKSDALSDILIQEGYSLEFNGFTLSSAENAYGWNGEDKDYVVTSPYGEGQRGFNTIKGAMRFIEKN